jgi:hypothetical protein
MKKTTTIEDLEHKMRAQLVQLYEAACAIDFPRGSDAAFRDALEARLQQGVAQLSKECAAAEDKLISIAQDVRLYKASAGLRNPDAGALRFRVALQKTLGAFFRLKEAVFIGGDSSAKNAAEAAQKASQKADGKGAAK